MSNCRHEFSGFAPAVGTLGENFLLTSGFKNIHRSMVHIAWRDLLPVLPGTGTRVAGINITLYCIIDRSDLPVSLVSAGNLARAKNRRRGVTDMI